MRKKQIELFNKSQNSFGGDLQKTRKGRKGRRPLSTKECMHLVLRSTKAVGTWSLATASNRGKIKNILNKFSKKYAVKINSLANVGNHLHLKIKLTNRFSYQPFIRAITAAIAMAVTQKNRWSIAKTKIKFWDRRPFSKIITSYRYLQHLSNYFKINELEGLGLQKFEARLLLKSQALTFTTPRRRE